MRIDQVLHWLCLQKSRSMAGRNCKEERILVDEKPVRPAAKVHAGQIITFLNPLGEKLKVVRLLDIPERQQSRRDAPPYYEVVADANIPETRNSVDIGQ